MRFGLPVLPWGFGGLGLIVPGAGRLGWGASLITESLTPFILPLVFCLVAVLYMVCITYLFVCVCVLACFGVRGFVAAGGMCRVCRACQVGRGGRGRKGEKLGRRMRPRKKE